MGLFSKLKNLITRKKDVAKLIKNKNEKQTLIEQKKFDSGLHKSSSALNHSIDNLAKKYRRLDDELIESIEEMLLMYDIGPMSTEKILNAIIEEIKYQNVTDPELIKQIIIDKLFVYYIQDADVHTNIELTKDKMNVILVSGVNGVGKTTSIAKLSNKYKKEGYDVCLIAADTFRAGAIEQLDIWSKRINVGIYKPTIVNQDPASVIYSGLELAKTNKYNLIICDTSGRLQNKVNLMNELKKINNVIKKFDSSQPIESLLVIDATTGQSGVNQAKTFNEVTKVTGIILTKMDSTSKGGIILAIKDALNLPVKFIGLGESIDDLQEFDLEWFINGITKELKIND